MVKLIFRIIVAILVALLLAIIGVYGNATVLQTLFTVLGIVFSISMSLLVSFSLSKILNNKTRKTLRSGIAHIRNMLLLDFAIATIAIAVALIWDEDYLRVTYKFVTIDVMLMSIALVLNSLLYEIYNFQKLHKLHTNIEDEIIKEEINKSNQ
jgi:hypothetical protein